MFESTIFEALEKPLSAIGVEVTRALTRMRPHKATVCAEFFLDVQDFARAGRCTVEPLAGIPFHAYSYFSESHELLTRVDQGWERVRWEGHTLEVLTLTWVVESADTYRWIIADSLDVARRFVRAVHDFDELATSRVLVFESGRFVKSALLGASVADGRAEDLVLGGTLLDDLRNDARRFFERKAFYVQHRLPWKRGLLLVGPPGNGKTQTIRALLKELGRPALFVRSFDKREHNIRMVFTRARKMAPVVLVLEDLDCLIDEGSRSIFLNELDGLAQNHGLLTLATTNHPEKLDRSILDRPSRFDRKFHFPLPADLERRRYLEKWNGSQPDEMKLTAEGLSRLVERSKGFTFAYLKELMLSASLRWADEGSPGAMDSIAAALLKTLDAEMASAAVLLGPIDHKRGTVGFAEARDT